MPIVWREGGWTRVESGTLGAVCRSIPALRRQGRLADAAQPAARPRDRRSTRTCTIGAALSAARETLGLPLDEIAETTRVRAATWPRSRRGQIDQLPSRPFTVGYVRAYAKALGLDADAAAARFSTEGPSPTTTLRTPVGVRHERRGRSG